MSPEPDGIVANDHEPATGGETRRRGLAKGLSALLGDLPTSSATRTLPIDALLPSPLQPRRNFDPQELADLAASIAAQGILQPLLVRPAPAGSGRYEIIAGERRWRAAQQARLHEVPVLVREIGDAQVLEMALVENLQRADLSPLEEASGYRRLIDDFRQTQDNVADLVGKSRSHVANTLRLLALPPEVKAWLDSGTLSAGHARALLASPDPVAHARRVIARGLNVRQTERLVQRGPARAAAAAPDANTADLEHTLGEALGLAVAIRHGKRGGTLAIRYRTLDQLQDVARRLKRDP
ncbi:MAG: ParB/RepB/Spo0J family partition protein [Alphaproteobacteria bacterium]|nr:ParB/RepB/Spo0J family partition protein [Alphaproteobacteria bacterium]